MITRLTSTEKARIETVGGTIAIKILATILADRYRTQVNIIRMTRKDEPVGNALDDANRYQTASRLLEEIARDDPEY